MCGFCEPTSIEEVMEEYMKGCTVSVSGEPGTCKECTEAFLRAVRVVKEKGDKRYEVK